MPRFGVAVVGGRLLESIISTYCEAKESASPSELEAIGVGYTTLDKECPSTEGWSLRVSRAVLLPKKGKVMGGRKVFVIAGIASRRKANGSIVWQFCVDSCIAHNMDEARGYIYKAIHEMRTSGVTMRCLLREFLANY